jgi:hypothetical protein
VLRINLQGLLEQTCVTQQTLKTGAEGRAEAERLTALLPPELLPGAAAAAIEQDGEEDEECENSGSAT